MPLYIGVDIWTGVTDTLLTHSQTLKDRATQLLMKYKSGTLVKKFRKNLMVPIFCCTLVFSILFVDTIIISKI